MKSMPKTKALAGWFGGARMIAEHVGEALRGCSWVGVPFAGGMSELLHIDASSILVSDLHRHIINLAQQVKIDRKKVQAYCEELPFHPDELRDAQNLCSEIEAGQLYGGLDLRFRWAVAYFVCCWMGRGGMAGTDGEFDGGMSVRWSASGGDSATRFRSATESLAAWDKVMPRCTFVCMDAFQFLGESMKRDKAGNGLYIDAPWPDDGDGYKHKFTIDDQCKLANLLSEFQKTRIVIRYGDHPLIRQIYPETHWTWKEIEGRTQANKTKAEVLITRKAT